MKLPDITAALAELKHREHHRELIATVKALLPLAEHYHHGGTASQHPDDYWRREHIIARAHMLTTETNSG